MQHRTTRNQNLLAAGASCLFILLGSILLPIPGVQEDEALFAVPFYLYKQRDFSIRPFHAQIPLMVMSYVGTVKTLLYSEIFRIWHVTVWSVRLPMVLAGALTVYLLYKFTSRAAGVFAGLTAAFLLATDPTFLVTNTFDWGPVALGHLLVVAACLSLILYWQENLKMRHLAQGFFFLGLALWNKALVFWVLAGLAAGALVFWREIANVVSLKRISVAAAGFLLGALPFLIYNVRHKNATISENARFEAPSRAKLRMLDMSLNGSGLLGFITAPNWSTDSRPPVTGSGKTGEWLERHLGAPRQSGFDLVFLASILMVPWWRRFRAAWFALIFMIVTWLAMAVTKGAGGAVHHSVLLWPFPEVFVGVVLSSVPWRRLMGVAAGAMVVMNLLVYNQYVVDFDRLGPTASFTDALFPLSAAFSEDQRPIYIVDWGMDNTLALFHQGRLDIHSALGMFQSEELAERDRKILEKVMPDPETLFVGHVDGREVFEGVNARVNREAAALGLRKRVIRVIPDSHGRPIFEIFRFEQFDGGTPVR